MYKTSKVQSLFLNIRHSDMELLLFSRSVRCIEINKESKLSFEKTVDRLPNLVDSSISWHLADTSKVGNLLKFFMYIS